MKRRIIPSTALRLAHRESESYTLKGQCAFFFLIIVIYEIDKDRHVRLLVVLLLLGQSVTSHALPVDMVTLSIHLMLFACGVIYFNDHSTLSLPAQ